MGSLTCGRWRVPGRRPLENKNQRDTGQRQKAEQPEIIHERPQMRLLIERVVNGGVGLRHGGDGIGVLRERVLRGGEPVRERRVA